ncbi:MAG: peptide ABC transporter substrate-binding protein, partial [Firmicutes bacterium]|nr:peptide ABC transporter substrate-binding protein [Bacillota bacterium]
RCSLRRPLCAEEEPPLREVYGGHRVACHLVEGGASSV